MRFARVNGVVIHHEVRGTVGKPVLVFSNSLGTDFRIWDAVVAQLEADYRIVLYDKRGHGLSEATPQPYALADHVDDLAALLDHLDISGATIIGLSVGGMIAQGLATWHPHLVSRLVLCDTAHKIGNDDLWNNRIEAVNTKGIAAISDGILERWFTPAFRSPENADFTGYTAMLTRTTIDGYAGTGFALRDADLTATTATLKLPTLCIVGDHDGSTPPDLVRTLAGLIEGARFEIVKDAGHLPCIEQPEKTAALIADFLRSTAPDA